MSTGKKQLRTCCYDLCTVYLQNNMTLTTFYQNQLCLPVVCPKNEKHGVTYLSLKTGCELTLTIASIISNVAHWRYLVHVNAGFFSVLFIIIFFFMFAGIKFRHFQAIAKFSK